MTGDARPRGRFLGRPERAEPGYVPSPSSPAARSAHTETRSREGSRGGRIWLAQALSGAALLAFLGVHLVAQHLLVPEGLRDHAAVLDYLRHPVALAAEVGLLAAVIVHACLGMRSSLVDVLADAGLRRASRVIALVGVVAFAYGLWLTFAILAGPGS